MCCRVKNFLYCIPLEGLGLFIGWLNLIIYFILTCFIGFLTIIALYYGSIGSAVLCVLILVFFICLTYYTKEFIDGINERNHNKMYGYRVMCIIGLVCSIIISVVVIVFCFAFMQILMHIRYQYIENDQDLFGDIDYSYNFQIKVLAYEVTSLAVEIYIFVCINSLYLEIKELRLLNGTQIPGHNIVINQQQQAMRTDNVCIQSPPSYNAAIQHGHSTQIVIPMQPMYPEMSNVKPQAV